MKLLLMLLLTLLPAVSTTSTSKKKLICLLLELLPEETALQVAKPTGLVPTGKKNPICWHAPVKPPPVFWNSFLVPKKLQNPFQSKNPVLKELRTNVSIHHDYTSLDRHFMGEKKVQVLDWKPPMAERKVPIQYNESLDPEKKSLLENWNALNPQKKVWKFQTQSLLLRMEIFFLLRLVVLLLALSLFCCELLVEEAETVATRTNSVDIYAVIGPERTDPEEAYMADDESTGPKKRIQRGHLPAIPECTEPSDSDYDSEC